MSNALNVVNTLAERVGIMTMMARPPGKDPHWPKRWRAQVQRGGRTLTTWGDEIQDAVLGMVELVERDPESRAS